MSSAFFVIAEGYTNKQIADKLVISMRTVEAHRYKIIEKLEIQDRAGLIKYARLKQLCY